MSRVVTASEIDRLHAQVADLAGRVHRVVTASEIDRLHAQVADLAGRVHRLEHPEFTEFFEDPATVGVEAPTPAPEVPAPVIENTFLEPPAAL